MSRFVARAFQSLAWCSLFVHSALWALSPEVAKLIEFETQGNAVAKRSDAPVKMEHFEIPLKLLKVDVSQSIPADVRDSLIFTKNGEQYLRWIINPEDTKWYKEVANFLTSHQVDATRHSYFTAYQTASRSYILEDPVSHAQFSAKVSTDKTGGHWKDKKQTLDDALQVRMASDFVKGELADKPMTHAVVMEEPALFGIEAIDQAMLVRTLAELTEGGKYYLPGFSAVNNEVGKKIAALNGSKDPASYWDEHYNKALARAIAEFAARTGLTYDSPHSQNFLVELDQNFHPTGRIVLRDFGDSYALKEFYMAKGRSHFLKKWEKDNITDGYLDVAIGTLHGNESPPWISDATYNLWGKDFYQAFEDEYSQDTGIPKAELSTPLSRSGMYFSKIYKVSQKQGGWSKYLSSLRVARKNTGSAGESLESCASVFSFAPAF